MIFWFEKCLTMYYSYYESITHISQALLLFNVQINISYYVFLSQIVDDVNFQLEIVQFNWMNTFVQSI